MRRLLLCLAVTCACSTPTAPSPSLAGTWAQNFSFPGASLVFSLDASGNGSGTYAIEAGRSGTVSVTGAFMPGMIALTIHYDYGAVRAFNGTLSDPNHLTGTFSDATGTVVFTRRE